jgi:hypothetical protein
MHDIPDILPVYINPAMFFMQISDSFYNLPVEKQTPLLVFITSATVL